MVWGQRANVTITMPAVMMARRQGQKQRDQLARDCDNPEEK